MPIPTPQKTQTLLQSLARASLASALAPLPGPKALLVDPSLYVSRLSLCSPLDLFTHPSFLNDHGLRLIAPLSSSPDHPRILTDLLALPSVVLLIRALNVRAARAAVATIRALKQVSEKPPNFLVLTTPRASKLVDGILQGIALPNVRIGVLDLGFLPFDADLVTLDWPDAYRQVVLEGDNSSLLATAAALRTLSEVTGVEYTTIRTAGAAATAVAEELLETVGDVYTWDVGSVTGSGSIGGGGMWVGSQLGDDDEEQSWSKQARKPVALVIVDRGVDTVTPCLTQWTYEGLLEESVWMHNNIMDLPIAGILSEDALGIFSGGGQGSGGVVRKTLRSDVDPIFAELRDENFWTAARRIGSVAKDVRDYYEKRPGRETAELSQVKQYVSKLKEKKSDHLSAAAHTAIASEISARTFDSYEFRRRFKLEQEMMEGSTATGRCVFISDMIARGESLCHVLRLCCLWSLTASGIDEGEFDFIRKEILAIFGLGVLPLIANLERAGMFVRSVREPQQNPLPWITMPNFRGSDTGSVAGSVASMVQSESARSYRTSRAMSEYSWQFARMALRLWQDFDVDAKVTKGSDIAVSAPYSGYTPLTVRLVEAGLSEEGWGVLPHIVAHNSLLPPGHVTLEHRRGGSIRRSGAEGDGGGFDAVVVFVGGICRAEASAVRRAAESKGVRVLIATTAVMAPDNFVMSLTDDIRDHYK